MNQLVGRAIQVRTLDEIVVHPCLGHIEHHIFIIGIGLYLLVGVAFILHVPNQVEGAALAPRLSRQGFTILIGLHSIYIRSAFLDDVSAARGEGIPHEVCPVFILVVFGIQSERHRHHREQILLHARVRIRIAIKLAIRALQSIGITLSASHTLEVTYTLRDSDIIGFLLVPITVILLRDAHRLVFLSDEVEDQFILALIPTIALQLALHSPCHLRNGHLQFVWSISLDIKI